MVAISKCIDSVQGTCDLISWMNIQDSTTPWLQARNIDDVKRKIAKTAQKALNSDTEDYLSSSAGEEEPHTNVIYYRINQVFW